MIIDDAHRTAFVHIPKNGGTSVSLQLAGCDSYGGAFRRKGRHPVLGPIHYAHIPLRYLAAQHPAEFDKVAAYDSFALARDPHARFASATFQRLEEFHGVAKIDITSEQALDEARRVILWLAGREHHCDLEYIHFTRQVAYVALEDRRIVRHVFALEDISQLVRTLEARCGVRLDPQRRENTNFASKGRLLALLRKAKPIYSRLTLWAWRERLLLALQRRRLQTPDALYARFRNDSQISRFVEDYYAADFELHATARARPPRQIASGPTAP